MSYKSYPLNQKCKKSVFTVIYSETYHFNMCAFTQRFQTTIMCPNFILNNNNCLSNEKNNLALCCFSHKFDKFV